MCPTVSMCALGVVLHHCMVREWYNLLFPQMLSHCFCLILSYSTAHNSTVERKRRSVDTSRALEYAEEGEDGARLSGQDRDSRRPNRGLLGPACAFEQKDTVSPWKKSSVIFPRIRGGKGLDFSINTGGFRPLDRFSSTPKRIETSTDFSARFTRLY